MPHRHRLVVLHRSTPSDRKAVASINGGGQKHPAKNKRTEITLPGLPASRGTTCTGLEGEKKNQPPNPCGHQFASGTAYCAARQRDSVGSKKVRDSRGKTMLQAGVRGKGDGGQLVTLFYITLILRFFILLFYFVAFKLNSHHKLFHANTFCKSLKACRFVTPKQQTMPGTLSHSHLKY